MIFIFYLIFDEISLSKQNSPRWDAALCGVTSGAILFAYVPQKGCQAYMSELWLPKMSEEKFKNSDTCSQKCLKKRPFYVSHYAS